MRCAISVTRTRHRERSAGAGTVMNAPNQKGFLPNTFPKQIYPLQQDYPQPTSKNLLSNYPSSSTPSKTKHSPPLTTVDSNHGLHQPLKYYECTRKQVLIMQFYPWTKLFKSLKSASIIGVRASARPIIYRRAAQCRSGGKGKGKGAIVC